MSPVIYGLVKTGLPFIRVICDPRITYDMTQICHASTISWYAHVVTMSIKYIWGHYWPWMVQEILADVTINPARYILPCFGLYSYQSHFNSSLFSSCFDLASIKRLAMRGYSFFVIVNFRILFTASQSSYWILID